ncbi:Lrp/AsnC family transcriptional regulator [Streptomyces sp. NBC_01381]|uniref:Lrp/AsnC family transcriptional regulator n=1 Tax=Streptomyces sp. NBC_01381 TaxID=2903845 RepID=UPI00224D2998|nr:AsnC family transcriptional regulator [Streptomyces sp. NBC_01381]MCX4671161.1 Lrp/AsnC family transcriptional regulator [Streptomyces sp. NBC_01381]
MLVLDDLDRGLIHALQVDGRAPFTLVADILGSSTQTVVRRYRRLYAQAGLRVVALPAPRSSGTHQWFVRLTAATRTAHDIAVALARRPDTSWVRLTSGGTEIVAIIHTTPTGPDAHALLLRDIPRTAGITAVSAHYLLHTYLGGPTPWRGRVATLDAAQQARLRAESATGTGLGTGTAGVTGTAAEADTGTGTTEAEPSGPEYLLTDADRLLLDALRDDARLSYAELAAVTGSTPSTVARRLTELRARGALFFDVDIEPSMLGVTVSALLWMQVTPAHLEAVATELAGHQELAVVAATTGPTNLVAHALCQDAEELHHYLTRKVALDAIARIETAPVLRTYKAAATLRIG